VKVQSNFMVVVFNRVDMVRVERDRSLVGTLRLLLTGIESAALESQFRPAYINSTFCNNPQF
jgi:hypothetical protein